MSQYQPHLPNGTYGKKASVAKRLGNIMYNTVTVALVCTVCYCGFVFAEKYVNDWVVEQEYVEIEQNNTVKPITSYGQDETQAPWGEFPKTTLDPKKPIANPSRPVTDPEPIDWQTKEGYTNKCKKVWDLNDEFPDVVGWLYVPGTKVNYPVCKCDTEFYLTHNYQGRAADAGALYMTSMSTLNPPGRNILIHGHNMNNGNMFGTLKNYTTLGTQAFFDNHRHIYFDSLYGSYCYEVFSVYVADKDEIEYRTHNFANDDAYLIYLYELVRKGMFADKTVTFTPNDRIITLSTCNKDAGSTMRTIVHARMIYPDPNISFATPEPTVTVTPTQEAATGTPTDGSTVYTTPIRTPTAEPTPDTSRLRVVKLNKPGSTPLNVRSGPATSFDKAGTLAHGTVVTVLHDLGDWLQIQTDDLTGYIYAAYTVPYDEFYRQSTPTGTATPAPTTANTPVPTPMETAKPENTEATVPENTEVSEPENTEATVPENTEVSEPENTEVSEPENTEATVPENTEVSEPENTEATEPENTEATVPENTEVTVPENTEVTVPENTEVTVPENTEVSEPENTEVSEPTE